MEGEASEAPDRLIGTIVGEKYRVIRRIGEGGMGRVYEGEHILIKRRVAIKVLRAEMTTNADVITRFHREAMAATSVGSEHIVEVTDMGRLDDGGPFMVLEYLEGHDLAHLIEEEGQLPLARVVHVVSQMCAGLAAAHDKGIVHRDLKPENVFLVTRGKDRDFAKILDFGISKLLDAQGDDQKSTTRTGMVLGTGYYMPPEQAMGKKDLDHRADIWALGVILFRALSGQYPFESDTYAGLLVKVVIDDPASLAHLRPELPDAAYAVVDRCLARKPEDRWPDCRALADALAQIGPEARVDVMGATAMGAAAFAGPTPVRKAPLRVGTELTPGTVPIPSDAAAVGPALPTPPPAARERPTDRQTPSSALVLALAGVAAAAALIAVLTTFGDSATTPPAVADPIEVVAPADAWAGASLDASTSTPTVGRATVRVRLSSVPAGATMTLDGAPLLNPFDDELPRGADMHVLETSAEGFRTDRRDLSLLFPADVIVTLEAGEGVRETLTHRPPHVGPHVEATSPPPEHTVTAPPSEQTVTSPPQHTVTAPSPEHTVTAPPVPEGVVVPPEQRLLKHLPLHH